MRWLIVCLLFRLPIIHDLGSCRVLSSLIFPPFDLNISRIRTHHRVDDAGSRSFQEQSTANV